MCLCLVLTLAFLTWWELKQQLESNYFIPISFSLCFSDVVMVSIFRRGKSVLCPKHGMAAVSACVCAVKLYAAFWNLMIWVMNEELLSGQLSCRECFESRCMWKNLHEFFHLIHSNSNQELCKSLNESQL